MNIKRTATANGARFRGFENGTAEIYPACRLGYDENKPLCEQGNSLSSELWEWEAAKGNDCGSWTIEKKNRCIFHPTRGRIITAVLFEVRLCRINMWLSVTPWRSVWERSLFSVLSPLISRKICHFRYPPHQFYIDFIHFPPSHGASSDLDRAPSLRRFLENLSDSPNVIVIQISGRFFFAFTAGIKTQKRIVC